MNISLQQGLLYALILSTALVFVLLNYSVEMSIASWLTIQEQSKDISYFKNIEKVNSLLIQTKGLEEITEKSIENYSSLGTILLILTIPTIILAIIIKKIVSSSKKIIDYVVPKWKIIEHSKIMIPAAVGIFVAIALSYSSSLSYISLIRKQTIINTIALIQDTKQPDVLNNLLITYIQNNLSEYWITTHGFLYFIFALIFPIVGSVWYYRRKELNFWIITLFISTAFTIPFWIVMLML